MRGSGLCSGGAVCKWQEEREGEGEGEPARRGVSACVQGYVCASTFGTRIQCKPIGGEGLSFLFQDSQLFARGIIGVGAALWPQEGTRALPALPEKEEHLHQKSVESFPWPLAADIKTSQAGGLKEALPGPRQAVPSAPPPPLPAFISVG